MKTHRSMVVIALFALLLSARVSVMAQQGATPNDPKPKAESCCSMDSCCCKSGSCDMKKDGMKHPMAGSGTMAGDGAMAGDKAMAGDGCCCCGGGSCDMAKQEKKDHPEGSCCNMKHKDMKQKDKKNPA